MRKVFETFLGEKTIQTCPRNAKLRTWSFPRFLTKTSKKHIILVFLFVHEKKKTKTKSRFFIKKATRKKHEKDVKSKF